MNVIYLGFGSTPVCASKQPTVKPTVPSVQPTQEPSASSPQPTAEPSLQPSPEPSAEPTLYQSVNIPSVDSQALEDLYVSTCGAHLNYGSSSSYAVTHWSFDEPADNPCAEQWYGVHCSDNLVTGLSLVDMNLIGSIPESLPESTDYAGVSGSCRKYLMIERVPTTLCQIRSLVRVDLGENIITCCYPYCLEHTAVEAKVHPSTHVCSIIPSLSGPSKDAVSSPALVKKSSSSNSNIFPLERQALQDLCDSTEGPNWYVYGSP